MSTYLMHHGTKGQKWGVRRYQNEDGTLTEAGRARYGGQKIYRDSGVRRVLTGERTVAKLRTADGKQGRITINQTGAMVARYNQKAGNYRFKAEEAKYRGNEKRAAKMTAKAEKMEKREKAYGGLRQDRIAYDEHTSTGKLAAQNFLFGAVGAENYRNARAMGISRGKALVTGYLGIRKAAEERYTGGAE